MRHRPAQEVLGLRFDAIPLSGRIALGLALAALWLLGRRYGGFTHDASLYAVQGLRVLDPASFAKDLFFVHGAQDAYTVFPSVYALLIGAFGAGSAALMVTVAGQIAFFAAAAALAFRIAVGQVRWWSLALLAAVSGYYGGIGVFRLAEPFATARTLSEPLVLAALACTLASRHRIAIAALAAAAALHPLVAAPGIAAVIFWHALGRPRLMWSIPVLTGLMLVAAVVWPGITMQFDPQWLAAVQDRSPHLFILKWLLPDWSRFLWGLCVAWIAMRFVEAPARRLVFVVAAIGLTGVAASWIAVDLLQSATAAGLQLWRTHWLMHFLAIVLAPVAAAGLWRSGNASRAAAACVAASFCFGRAELPASAVLAALAVALDASERRWPGWMGEGAFRLTLLAALCAASAGLLFEVQSRLPSVYGATRSPAWSDYVHAAASVGGLLPLALLLWLAACSRFRAAGCALAAAAFALGIAAWDARAPWPRFVEQASGMPNPFRAAISPGAQVFWPAPHSPAWLVLRRPTWFSADQGAGIVFSRDTAIEYAGRKRASRDLIAANENCRFAAPGGCRIDSQPARNLCGRRGGPAYLVLDGRIDARASIDWPLAPGILPGVQALHMFSCRDLAGNEKGRR